MLKLKKGDQVEIMVGKDKGKRAKIERVLTKSQSVLLPNLNVYKRHLKKQNENNPGGVVPIPRPLSVAKVMLICPKCGKPSRVGFEVKSGKKQRVCRNCKAKI